MVRKLLNDHIIHVLRKICSHTETGDTVDTSLHSVITHFCHIVVLSNNKVMRRNKKKTQEVG